MVSDGQVLINYNGKDYNFDHHEQVLGRGWSTGMEQLNPLTSTSVLYVFKLPKEIIGKAYYHPGREDDRHFIEIGDIK